MLSEQYLTALFLFIAAGFTDMVSTSWLLLQSTVNGVIKMPLDFFHVSSLLLIQLGKICTQCTQGCMSYTANNATDLILPSCEHIVPSL